MNREYVLNILQNQLKESMRKGIFDRVVGTMLQYYTSLGGEITEEIEKLLCQQIVVLTEKFKACTDIEISKTINRSLVDIIGACYFYLCQNY